MTAIFFSIASFISTFAGGTFALRFTDRLHFILSFTAGVLLGVVSFDVLPEIFSLANEHQIRPTGAMIALVAGFIVFHSLEKFVLVHQVHEGTFAPHRHPKVGILSGFAMAGHSFLDGIGIGLAFQVSHAVGVVVTIAIVAHDFCDGLNTVGLMLTHHNSKRRSLAMLVLDAIAPVLGAASTLAFHVPADVLLLFLGFFSGFLLYIAASDILPEAHSQADESTVIRLIGLTILGAAFIYFVVRMSN